MTTNITLHRLRNVWCALSAAMLLLGGSGTATAFTTADRAAAYGAWKNAFYFTSNGRGYFRDKEGSGTVQYFWQSGTDMEVVIRAVQLGLDSAATVDALCQGFTNNNGVDWSYDTWNDDVSGMSRSMVGAYEITGNRAWLNLAKSGFDLGYSRGFVPGNGGLNEFVCNGNCLEATETTDGIIASCRKLAQYLPDSSYSTKAQGLYSYLVNYTFNPTTGMVMGTPQSGVSSQAPSDYGFFMQCAVLYGNTAYAQKASSYQRANWDICMSQWDSGANGICLRGWGTTGIDVPYAQQVCDNAWGFRNSRGLTSYLWTTRLSDATPVNTYDAMQLVMGMLNLPPIDSITLTINSATYTPVDGSSGGANVTSLVAGHVSSGTLSFAVNNTTMGGDPAPNKAKQLVVNCTAMGKPETFIVAENSTINIMTGGGSTESAIYVPVDGSNGGVSATSRLGSLHGLTICNSTMGGDAAPGKAKQFKAVYNVSGFRETVTVSENGVLNLDHP
jgi:hypothetical protein